VISPTALMLAAALTGVIGALGGLGGAILLVPILVVAGMDASIAAPLGLVSVASVSVGAGAAQLAQRSVNHRLGVTIEVIATTGAVVGATVSNLVPDRALELVLAFVALATAVASARRKGLRNPPDPSYGLEDVGERVGTLVGAYPLGDAVAPYRPKNLPLGLSLMGIAGLVAGMTGTSGGFIKTPTMSEVMHVPTKVAAATTTFTIGVTAAAALIVFAYQGRVTPTAAAGVIVGSLAGGWAGARLQIRLHPAGIRLFVAIVLAVIAILLVAR
jgi:uncharacterized protein